MLHIKIKSMKTVVAILIFNVISISLFASNSSADSLLKAQDLYSKSNYVSAIQIYNSIVDSGYESADLYYNLGNSYFRNNEMALAIVNYERALLLNPQHEDAKNNLEIVKSQQIDKIEIIPPFFISLWIDSFFAIMTSNTWTILSFIFLALFLSSIYIFLYSRQVSIKQIFFGIGLFLGMLFIVSIIGASKQKNRMTDRNNAIILASSVTAKSTPSDSGTNLFVIHEGLKVQILDKVSGYVEIKLSNGEVGWILSEDVVVI